MTTSASWRSLVLNYYSAPSSIDDGLRADLNGMFPPEFQVALTSAQRRHGFRYSARGQLYLVDFENLIFERAEARDAVEVERRAQRQQQLSCRASLASSAGVVVGADRVDDTTCFFDFELAVASS